VQRTKPGQKKHAMSMSWISQNEQLHGPHEDPLSSTSGLSDIQAPGAPEKTQIVVSEATG